MHVNLCHTSIDIYPSAYIWVDYVYVHTYIYIYILMCTSSEAYIKYTSIKCVHIVVFTRIFIYIHIYWWKIQKYASLFLILSWLQSDLYVYMYIYIHLYVYIYIHLIYQCIYTYTYPSTYIHICVLWTQCYHLQYIS
jgi:hypothetical protein